MVYIFAAESIDVSSTTLTQSVLKATEFGEIKQRLKLLRRSRSSKVTDFGTNRKPICDFLLVINSNLYLLSCTVSEIQPRKGPISLHFSSTLWFNPPPPTEGFPWDDLRKISPGCRQVTNVLNGAETLPKISISLCTNVTDRRQTDRRTDDDI